MSPDGIAVSEAFEVYLDDLRETVYFPKVATLRNQGVHRPESVTFS
ncbi:hypothetical protein [Haloplanus rubicundus]|nr:hypothetical protein [Haloplanus rubicundus]